MLLRRFSLFLFRRVAIGLSAQRPGFDLGPVHVRFVLWHWDMSPRLPRYLTSVPCVPLKVLASEGQAVEVWGKSEESSALSVEEKIVSLCKIWGFRCDVADVLGLQTFDCLQLDKRVATFRSKLIPLYLLEPTNCTYLSNHLEPHYWIKMDLKYLLHVSIPLWDHPQGA